MQTDFHRQAKVVLVTDATTGIGASIAHVLAAAGHRVWGTGRRAKTAPPLPGKPGSIALDAEADIGFFTDQAFVSHGERVVGVGDVTSDGADDLAIFVPGEGEGTEREDKEMIRGGKGR